MLFDGVVKNDFITFFYLKMIVLECTKTNLWTLKILQDSNRFSNALTRFANPTNLIIALTIITVAEVETKSIDSRSQ
jgi:hypothetical protein